MVLLQYPNGYWVYGQKELPIVPYWDSLPPPHKSFVMDTQPAIMTYAPLITSVVIGLGIVVTLAIIGAKIIFNLAGLFKDVKTLTDMIKELRTDVAKGNEELRHEIHDSTNRVVDALAHHAHTGTDGGVIFTLPVNR